VSSRPKAEDAGGEAVGFVLTALAAWRLTHLLAYEDGPADAVARLRERLGDGLLGQLVDCFDCLGIWVAVALAPALRSRRPWPIRVLALAGAAGLLERATAGGATAEIQPLD
jgi:hypothetical protein